MYEARSAEDIRIYESIVIEFLLRLKIHKICARVSRYNIEKRNSLSVLTLDMQYHGLTRIVCST